MKIGLIDPGSKKLLFNENFPHIGLAYLAAVLEKEGHKVTCLDVGLASGKDRTEKFLKTRYDLIGLSVTSFTLRTAYDIAEKIKSLHKNTVIVLGGPHVAIGMETTLESPKIDFAVYGEGEQTMAELVEIVKENKKGQPADFYGVKGLIFRDQNRVVCNPPRPRIADLNQLPYPAFHLFQMERYGIYPLFTSRGCPFGCSFCSIKAIWGTLWKSRNEDNIIQEIEYAQKEFNWKNKPFNIIDDSFNVNPKRVMDFCEQIIKKGLNIKWFSSGFRADRVSLQLAYTMKKSGCIGISVGIESANDKILKRIKKKETISQCTEGCRNLALAKIPVQAQFIIGNPGDTFETVKESIEYAKKQNFAKVAFYLALPYPKTELWEYVKNNGTFLQEDYTKFHHFSDIPVFETPEFTAPERIKAYKIGRNLGLKTQIRQEIKTKLERIKRLDFQDLNFTRIRKAIARVGKYFLDLAFRKEEKV